MTKAETVARAAESQLGAPYVYGTWGKAVCSVSLRRRYASYRPEQQAITYKRCPILSGSQSTCAGCKYQGRLAFDCRGFTHWCLDQAGIGITGQAVGTQWSGKNWAEKGTIESLPDLTCCVFIYTGGKWSHTGLHLGGGRIIHCSGEVKEEQLGSGRGWTHYAVPAGLYTDEEIKNARRITPMPIYKKGSSGPGVKELQEMLNALGYDCGTADGVYGTRTQAAVVAFQKHELLTADGIAGPKTLTVLAARAASVNAELRSFANAQDDSNVERDDDPDDPEAALPPTDPIAYSDALTRAELVTIQQYLKNALELIEAALMKL